MRKLPDRTRARGLHGEPERLGLSTPRPFFGHETAHVTPRTLLSLDVEATALAVLRDRVAGLIDEADTLFQTANTASDSMSAAVEELKNAVEAMSELV